MEPKKETIDRIIDLEWNMFHSVNEGSELAWCQNDRKTFDGMRRGQVEAWDDQTAGSYLKDLEEATAAGRNLAEEKYIFMMRSTAPVEFLQLMDRVPGIDCETETLAEEITDRMIAQTVEMRKKYPYISSAGRPLRSTEDTPALTSVETYQLSELLTYSKRTLRALLAHLIDLERNGISLAERIQEYSLRTYGFKSLAEADAYVRGKSENR